MADDEQTHNENDPGVEENVQTEPAPEAQQTAVSHEHRNQWIAFGILVGILIGVVLVIALLRPLIFDRIVPAVMGDFVTPAPAVIEEAVPAEDTETGENEVSIPAASGGETSPVEEPVAEQTTVPVEETAAPPEPAPVTHTVQTGDNLTKISQQYGVSVQEIMAANNLTNADYISVGQILVIPAN